MSEHHVTNLLPEEHAKILRDAATEAFEARLVLTQKLVRLEDILAALGFIPVVTPPSDVWTEQPTRRLIKTT